MTRVKISDVRQDWRRLDTPDFDSTSTVRLISHESFTSCPEIDVEYVPPGLAAKLFRHWPRLFHLVYAFQLVRHIDKNSVFILNGGCSLWPYVGLMNRFCTIRKRRILCWDVFVEIDRGWKRAVMHAAMKGFDLSVLWSKAQVSSHARCLGMPEERFIFLPYKANHSQGRRYHLPVGSFVFSGGNGKRDYRCLVDAVRGTDIPVVISATAPEIRRQIEQLPNVIVVSAPEPAFAQLQAASAFVVIPMTYTGLKGGGEANFCNAMWHGRPVVAADSIAACDYIVDGQTGYVVPSGDWPALRRRIEELWHHPEKQTQMGDAGRRHAEDHFTHVKCIRRLLRLALLIGETDAANS